MKDCKDCTKKCNCIDECNCELECGCKDCYLGNGCGCDGECGCDDFVEEVYLLEKVDNIELNVLKPDMSFGKIDFSQFTKAGKWIVLYFYPAAFSGICQTEVEHMIGLADKLAKNNTVVIGISTDKNYSHKAWVEQKGWKLNHYMAEDPTTAISTYFRTILPNGAAMRGTFIIDPDGILKLATYLPPHVGRDFDSLERDLLAVQADKEGKLVPCAWKPGMKFAK